MGGCMSAPELETYTARATRERRLTQTYEEDEVEQGVGRVQDVLQDGVPEG